MIDSEGAVDAVVNDLDSELDDDVLGLWRVIDDVRELCAEDDEAVVVDRVRDVLSELRSRHALIGDRDPRSGAFLPWDDDEGAVDRVIDEWRALGRDPGIGEVAWLGRTDAGTGVDAPQRTMLRDAPTMSSLTEVERIIDEVTAALLRSLEQTTIPISFVFVSLWRARAEWSQAEIWEAAERVVSRLADARAVFQSYDGETGTVRPWPDQAGAVARAAAEWRALGRNPSPTEIGSLTMRHGD